MSKRLEKENVVASTVIGFLTVATSTLIFYIFFIANNDNSKISRKCNLDLQVFLLTDVNAISCNSVQSILFYYYLFRSVFCHIWWLSSVQS